MPKRRFSLDSAEIRKILVPVGSRCWLKIDLRLASLLLGSCARLAGALCGARDNAAALPRGANLNGSQRVARPALACGQLGIWRSLAERIINCSQRVARPALARGQLGHWPLRSRVQRIQSAVRCNRAGGTGGGMRLERCDRVWPWPDERGAIGYSVGIVCSRCKRQKWGRTGRQHAADRIWAHDAGRFSG